ncbi:hypothetical protein FACS1894159_10710 [Bacteroidia bacterium]|nr:hypothetical protein FACS1894159_10710 [Bacteroidia bacterium]
MKPEFDFDMVGKRLPYSVPEGFFEASSRRALEAVERHRRRRRLRTVLLAPVGIAAAAAVALGLFLSTPDVNPVAGEADQYTAIDRFVGSLSDQEVLELDKALSTDYFLSENVF